MRNKYEIKKQQVRDEAIDFQLSSADYNYSYSELAGKCAYFTKLGKRYGLLKEFRENGII